MSTLTISLPDLLQQWVDHQAASGSYSDAGDYVRELIRRDQQRTQKIASMQALVDEGLKSGISDESMDDILASLKNAAE
jgi:antitoxin ParD1/3/4